MDEPENRFSSAWRAIVGGSWGVSVGAVILALLAGACWALYIVSTAATGRRWAGVDGLAVASTVATLAIAPFAVAAAFWLP